MPPEREPPLEIETIEDYHAHVYFDAETREPAQRLREAVEARFAIEMGRWHEKPVGPHPCWSYQIAFKPEVFPQLIPWLALNREDLVIFTHPNTGQDLEDHRDRAIWMGAKLDLKLEIFDA